ncbi:MAG: putative SOS response-associated peptidase YedK [Psychromonas sp.]|jgi:putative SOS response-associated peptidase YedK
MCYSNSLTSKNVDLKKKYKKEIPANLPENPLFLARGFNFPYWRVITGKTEIQQMSWGLIPSWFKGENAAEIASKTLNARSETLLQKPSFRHLIQQKHCIIPSTGFFEYHTNDKEKVPYFIYPKQDSLFSMAGLYDEALDLQSGEIVQSFTILTCPANSKMEEIHNTKKRMPVLLDANGENDWLEMKAGCSALLKPSPDNWMDAYKINPKIMKGPEHNTVKVQEIYHSSNLDQGSLF